jgi:hypothetical protein
MAAAGWSEPTCRSHGDPEGETVNCTFYQGRSVARIGAYGQRAPASVPRDERRVDPGDGDVLVSQGDGLASFEVSDPVAGQELLDVVLGRPP